MLLIFSVSVAGAYSQNITLKGKLTDKTDKAAITGATIKLVSQKDSAQSRLVVTDKAGNFNFVR